MEYKCLLWILSRGSFYLMINAKKKNKIFIQFLKEEKKQNIDFSIKLETKVNLLRRFI